MYQGSIGLFVNTLTGENLWLWKVRSDKGIVYIDLIKRTVYLQSEVDDAKNLKGRSIRFVSEIDALSAINYFTFRAPDPQELVKNKSVFDMAEQADKMQKEISRLNGIITQAAEAERNAMAQRDNLNYDLEKLQYQLEAAKKQTDGYLFTYVYGKHSAENTVEYCWYADPTLAKQVKIGDTISVNTSRGQQLAIVTRIEKSNQYRNHKRVLDVVHSANCFEDDLPY